jgi:nicotinamidase/pyrazinamidase
MQLTETDALLIIDVQNDFLPGGALAVSGGNEIVPLLNRYIALFAQQRLPVIATRDWHPADHCSFVAQGGIWPAHCVANSEGAAFPALLALPPSTVCISKATNKRQDAYSAFDHTDLANRLHLLGTSRLFAGGLATDYCVLHSVIDALSLGFQVCLLMDAVRAVDARPDDGQDAIKAMLMRGAVPVSLVDIQGGYQTRPSPSQ